MRNLIGKPAPYFNAPAIVGGEKIIENFSLKQYLGEKYVIFFFYPMDFTFVCPTEILAFQKDLPEFEKRNVQVVACSTDAIYSHYAWLHTPRNKGGIQGVTYPLVADATKTIAAAYGVLDGEYSFNDQGELIYDGSGVAYRGLFLIDKQGIIRHMLINDNFLGRSTEEALRLVDALQYYEKYGEVCPANWQPGKKALKATPESISEYLINN
ncbi:MAG: peroxiredoxin [Bacteroidales bacterium]|nr:peroxiredoxin [Bacteroidales bacterium]